MGFWGAPKGKVLVVVLPAQVSVVDVGILLANLNDPLGQRDRARVAHVAAARVERHDRLMTSGTRRDQKDRDIRGTSIVNTMKKIASAAAAAAAAAVAAAAAGRSSPRLDLEIERSDELDEL